MRFIPAMVVVLALAISIATPVQGTSDSDYDWMGSPVQVTEGQKEPDYLNPFAAGRPEWDPFGPGEGARADIPSWDPYSPSSASGFIVEKADPIEEGLTIEGALRQPNQLYMQMGITLVTAGSVNLAEGYTLWARVGRYGSFNLYDSGTNVLFQGYLTPGWYRIKGGYAEIMTSHLYTFVCGALASNNLSISVNPGSYPLIYGLTGRVVDPNGAGIPEVTVRMSGSEGGRFTQTTNAFGYYGMDLPSGTYAITASRPGYQFTTSAARVWTGTISAARLIIGYPLY
ncbi:MAG: carboxypeptidase regulatory-like domain-containing protein [Methanotrichaceae archaeon]|nr:carboxypeptidase regulatory-like domain-containing protein [Methanotrichaceae archaeon]